MGLSQNINRYSPFLRKNDEFLFHHFCSNSPRADTIDPDLLLGTFECHGFCECDDSCLGGTVGRVNRAPRYPENRGCADNRASSVFFHDRDGRLGYQKDSLEIDGQHSVPILRRRVAC